MSVCLYVCLCVCVGVNDDGARPTHMWRRCARTAGTRRACEISPPGAPLPCRAVPQRGAARRIPVTRCPAGLISKDCATLRGAEGRGGTSGTSLRRHGQLLHGQLGRGRRGALHSSGLGRDAVTQGVRKGVDEDSGLSRCVAPSGAGRPRDGGARGGIDTRDSLFGAPSRFYINIRCTVWGGRPATAPPLRRPRGSLQQDSYRFCWAVPFAALTPKHAHTDTRARTHTPAPATHTCCIVSSLAVIGAAAACLPVARPFVCRPRAVS